MSPMQSPWHEHSNVLYSIIVVSYIYRLNLAKYIIHCRYRLTIMYVSRKDFSLLQFVNLMGARRGQH